MKKVYAVGIMVSLYFSPAHSLSRPPFPKMMPIPIDPSLTHLSLPPSNPPSESAQRIGAGLAHVLQSSDLQEKNAKIAQGILNLIRQMVNDTAETFVKEIHPEDAQKFLPTFDALNDLVQNLSYVAAGKNPEGNPMTPLEQMSARKALETQLLSFMFQFASEYGQAFKENLKKESTDPEAFKKSGDRFKEFITTLHNDLRNALLRKAAEKTK